MVRIAAYALLVVFAAASLLGWSTMPSVPATFGPMEWFGPLAIMGAIVILLRTIRHVLPKRPHLLNLPDRERYRKLPDERKLHIIRHAQHMMDWLSIEVSVLGILILFGLYHEPTHGEFNGYVIAALVFGVAVSPLVSLTYVAKMQSELTRQSRAHVEQQQQNQQSTAARQFEA